MKGKGMTMKTEKSVTLYFLDGPNECIVVTSLSRVPHESRYVCSTEGYNVFDDGETFYAVQELNKWNK